MSAIPQTRRHPRDTPTSNANGTAPPRRRPDQQSLRHGATQTTPWSASLKTRRRPRDNGTAPHPRHAQQQSPSHSDTHATHPAAIPMAQRHPRDTIPMAQRHPRDTPRSNPHGTAPHMRHAHQQSPWHSGTHATQQHPLDTPRSNPHGTAAPTRHAQEQSPAPTRHAQQQSPWHSGTHATRPAAIPMAQPHPRDTLRSNPHGTAAPTRHAQQQSSWHSATHAARATRPTPIVTACHCVPRHSAAHATRPTQPAAAFHKTSAPSLHPQIHGFPAPATISQHVTRERAPAHANSRTGPRNPAILASAHDSLRLPRKTMPSEAIDRTIPHACHAKRTLRARFLTPATRIHVRDTSGGHLAPRLPRETHAQQRPNARFPTPATRIHRPLPSRARQCIRSPTPATRNARAPTSKWTFPHTCHADPPRPVPSRARQCIRSPTPATRNARPPFPRDTRPDANPHGTELTTHPRRHRDDTATTPRRHRADTQQTKRTRVQPPDPQTINGNPSLRIREKALKTCKEIMGPGRLF